MPELRKDPVVGRWVIISTERSLRPTSFTQDQPPRGGTFCPFCPGNEDSTPPEVWVAADDPARHPELARLAGACRAQQVPGAPDRGRARPAGAKGLYDKMNGIGAHEVVIEGPEHSTDLSDLSLEHLTDVLTAYRERVLDLHRDRRFRYVLIFKNHGSGAGATLEHTHTQLIATPIVPKSIQEEIDGARRYFRAQGALRVLRHRAAGDAGAERPARRDDERPLHRGRAVRAAVPVRDVDPAARAPGRVPLDERPRGAARVRRRAARDAAAAEPRARPAAVQLRDSTRRP
jgi:hypothetical protein